MMTRLQDKYTKTIAPELKTELHLDNIFSVPKLKKVVVNAGIGRLLQQQPKSLDGVLDSIARITGQKPMATKAKKAISAFKTREGQIVGATVTLRGRRMYEFVDKLVNSALPRTRDFRGVSRKGFDHVGNYSLGIREQLIFPEMAQEENATPFGLEITVVTTAKTPAAGYLFLKKLGFPFKD